MNCTALAYDAPVENPVQETTIVNLSHEISAQELHEIEQSVGAYVTMSDGKTAPVASVVTTEDVPLNECSAYALSDENSYKVTVQTTASNDKIVSDSGEHNYSGLHVSATLELIWTGGSGLNNVIKKVSGARTITAGSVNWTTVQWGDGWKTALT